MGLLGLLPERCPRNEEELIRALLIVTGGAGFLLSGIYWSFDEISQRSEWRFVGALAFLLVYVGAILLWAAYAVFQTSKGVWWLVKRCWNKWVV